MPDQKTEKDANAGYMLQVLMNPGTPRARWVFDSEVEIRSRLHDAQTDMECAIEDGFAPEHVRLVVLHALSAKESS